MAEPELVRVQRGRVTDIGLPETGTLKNGRVVSGYDQLPDDVLIREGWQNLQDDGPPPITDPRLVATYTRDIIVENGQAIAVYTPITPPPTAFIDGKSVVVHTADHDSINFRVNGSRPITVPVDDATAELVIDNEGEGGLYTIHIEELGQTLEMELAHGS